MTVVCEPKHSQSGVTAAVAVLAVVAIAPIVLSAALSVVVPLLPAVTVTILAMCAAGVVVLRHLVLYGRQRKPRPRRMPVPVRPALTRGPLAIEAPQPWWRVSSSTQGKGPAMPISNSNSFNGNSAYTVAVENRGVRSLPWVFRAGIPGFQGGWPPQ